MGRVGDHRSAADAGALRLCLSAAGAVSPSGPGFWLGLWHGFIAPISLIGSGFVADHRIYAFPNSELPYHVGFLLGLSAWGGGGAYSTRR